MRDEIQREFIVLSAMMRSDLQQIHATLISALDTRSSNFSKDNARSVELASSSQYDAIFLPNGVLR